MSLQVKARSYKDHLNRAISFPVGNQTDKGVYIVDYTCFFGTYATQNSPVQFLGGADSIIQLSIGTWDELGITAGDTVTFYLENSDATTILSGTSIVLIADGPELKLDISLPVSITSMDGYVYTDKIPEAIEVEFNLVPSTQTDGMESIIDNTVTVLSNNQLSTLSVGNTLSMTQLGNKSGSIINASEVTRGADEIDPVSGGTILRYNIAIAFQWHGYLSALKQDYFFDVKTVTPIVSTSIFPQFNNAGIRLWNVFKLDNDGNSGFRDENFNQGIDNFSVQSFVWRNAASQPISNFDYSQPSEFEFTISTLAGFGTNFGLAFFNDITDFDLISATAENDNGNFHHGQHTILAETSSLTATSGQSFVGYIGKNGEQLSFSNIQISIAGSIATVKGLITPNAEFIDKFSNEDLLDKNFAFLFRCETNSFTPSNYSTTVNKTLWLGQGQVAPVILGPLPVVSHSILDHGLQIIGGDFPPVIIEDDNIFNTLLRLKKGVVHKSITLKNIAYNIVTGDFFDLESYTLPINETLLIDGTQNMPIPINTYYNNLLPTAMNNLLRYVIQRVFFLDNPTEYGIFINFPTLERWEYWIPQNGVDILFYNNANKDWRNYSQIGDWVVASCFEVEVDQGSYRNIYPYRIVDYNHNPNVSGVFSFERLDGTPITNPLIGEVVKVICTWTCTGNAVPNWAAITVEPTESQPRYLSSSLFPDNSPTNPLIGVNGSGGRLTVSGSGTNTIVTTVLFDPNRLNTQGGVKFTARLEDDSYEERTYKEFKLVQLPNIPTTSGKGSICCDCEPDIVLASSTENDLFKNDITSVFHKLDDIATDTCEFKIYKEGEVNPLPQFGIVLSFPKDNGLRGFCYNWRDYVINHGGGCYRIVKEITVAGLSFDIEIGHYKLFEYSEEAAEETVRIVAHYNKEAQYNEYGALKRANFADSNFETSFRFKGYFGSWQPNPEVINHYAFNGMLRNAKIRYKGSYALVMTATTICKYEKLTKEILLFSSILKCSDHNWTNPNQRQEIIWTVLNDEQSVEIEYYEASRKAAVMVGLKDMFNNEVSRFDGSINPMNGVTFQLATIGTSGTGGVCTPANVEAKNTLGNTVDSGTFASGSSGTLNAPNATVTVKTVSNVVIATISVPSGESDEIIIADPSNVVLTVNTAPFITATSPSQDIGLKNSIGNNITGFGIVGSTIVVSDSEVIVNVDGVYHSTILTPIDENQTVNIIL